MKRIFAAVLATGILMPSLAFAQSTSGPVSVQQGSYVVESRHTQVQFSVVHFGINEYFGIFPDAKGTLELDPGNPAATRLDIVLPVASVSTTNAVLDRTLTGSDWLDAAKFPTMRFTSTSVTRTGPRTATIVGNLTLHGITKPVSLDATLHGAAINPMNKAYTIGFKATGVVKRSEFGIDRLVPMVSDDTALTITAAFEKKAG